MRTTTTAAALFLAAMLAGCGSVATQSPDPAANKRAPDSICRPLDQSCARVSPAEWERMREDRPDLGGQAAP
jgi:hypothetical protein